MAKKKPTKWIAGAIKNPGALTKKAKAKGQTVSQFCAAAGPKASTSTKRQCALAKTLSKMPKRGKKKGKK